MCACIKYTPLLLFVQDRNEEQGYIMHLIDLIQRQHQYYHVLYHGLWQ